MEFKKITADEFDDFCSSNFVEMDGSGSRFPSALIGFNVPVIESLDGITLNAHLIKLNKTGGKK